MILQKLMELLTLGTGVALVFSTLFGQGASNALVGRETLPNGLPFHLYELSNGLTIYIVENHKAPVFTFQTWFDVGSKHEKLDPKIGATGLAHLFEHMMFRGTTNYADGEFDRILTRNGLYDGNATTWLDRTNYYESLPADQLELVVKLESDRMQHLVLDQETLDTERDAVLGERAMCQDDPETVAYDKLFETAYTKHPYRYTTIGTEAEIRSFTKEMAEYFYNTYYSPGNAALLIAGDVNPQDAMRLVMKYYGAIPEQPIPQLLVEVEPPQTVERRVEIEHEQLTQQKLILGYHIPETYDPDLPALWVLENLLTTGEGSSLEEAWVNAGLAVSLSGSLGMYKDPGLFMINADVQIGRDASELLGALDRVLAELSSKLTDRQLGRAKNQLLLGAYLQWEDNNTLASFMGEFIMSTGNPLNGFELIKAVKKVTTEDLKRVARTYLKAENRTIVVASPK